MAGKCVKGVTAFTVEAIIPKHITSVPVPFLRGHSVSYPTPEPHLKNIQNNLLQPFCIFHFFRHICRTL
ncbi:Uncharacterized protein dnm_042730 [Desulfonema magnum]|uniref:Uncharacterized protein n=1 Tax=Desulfonema magnum TaxID=45655 RepID=A0A975BMH4_9BACT|nr:Uncharacterized protein dnm_042730 [Desulfonema magnum]